MPLYEYQCEACGHRFEKIVKFSDPPLEVCPVCGGKVQKQISSPAFAFKGTGWYVTDYAKKDSGSSKDKDAKDAKDAKDSKDSKGSKESKDTKDSGTAAKDSSKSESSSSSSSESSSSTAPASKPAAKD